jgi:serine/threonine protein kinase
MQAINSFIKNLSTMTSLTHTKSKLNNSLRSSEEYELEQRGYQLGNIVGEGSYAKVHIAFSEHLNKKIAIKVREF